MRHKRIMIIALTLIGAFTFANGAYAAATHSAAPAAAHVIQANGACGGGNGKSQQKMIDGWRYHNVLDDVARTTGQTPGTDGETETIVRQNLVLVITTRGVWVTNNTCQNGRFMQLKKRKFIPAGTPMWVPARLAPAAGMTSIVSLAFQDNCGNKQTGHIPVRRPGKPSTPQTPKKPLGPGDICTAINSPGAIVCSTATYVNVCGTMVQYTGSPKDIHTWTQQYIKDHCQPTVTTTVCSVSGAINFGQPGPCAFPTPPPPCSCQPPQPCSTCQPPPPPVVQPPTIISITVLNDVTAGQCTVSFRVTAGLLNSDSGTVTLSPTYGHMESEGTGTVFGSNIVFSVGGGQSTVSATYCAPTEVPPSGTDNIVVTVVDNTTGKTVQGTPSTTPASPMFQILSGSTP